MVWATRAEQEVVAPRRAPDEHATVRLVVNERPTSRLYASLRADALDVLQDVVQWRLTAPRWATVRSALEAMRAAYDAGDVDTLRDAVSDLELAGPVRANSLAGDEVGEPPAPVYDVANSLRHDLSGEGAPPPEDRS
jgi:CATRA-associated small protein